ncbi:hypothetical protein [Archangium primigenium]|uniref:hypothetical protein n=1 Tax=[Archangium] primigenium TaxID=2792470 RepID=UPI00195C09B2|nr:hypothetical protein [Archangium primigenium]MBM7112017.1 hypothetical protein [Archangium primigenium]
MTSLAPLARRAFLLLGLGPLLGACGGPDAMGLEPEEDFTTRASALCTDPDIADVSATLGTQPGSAVSGESNGDAYGSPECPRQYVVEALSTSGKHVIISAAWGDSSVQSSAALCRAAWLRATAYGSATGASWTQLGSLTVQGSWDDTFGCSFMWPQDKVVLTLSSSPHARLRVTARAYITKSTGTEYHRVKARIAIPLPPPPPPELAPGDEAPSF